ncbi:PilN domain-containing protein [Xanthomonas arboricola]|uniref:PilN domain-containing protein n=1 Tax=Xanthomonas arboricola TaxID=56448 RepID=UPI000C86605E|nr:PilN domain-containing protein [Xanthomonas arboricola]SOU06191.1 fimbrial assembly membrane protein [Xanthomonas arboricola pv. fragariae]
MARINLLPWRAERRKAREREFYSMLGFAALGGVLLSVLIWFYYDAQISGQTERNAFLAAEIDKVKAQNEEIKELDKKKDRLLARKKVIEELQANRSQMVHLFDSLVRTIPDGVALTNIKQDGDILTLEGRSQSNARVSTYMRNLEGSGWMTNPDLSIIEAKSQDKAGQPAGPSMDTKTLPYVFTLKVKLANPNEADKNGTAPVDAQAPGATPAGTAPAGAPAAAPAAPAPATSPAAAPAPVQPAPASANRPQEGAAS